MFINLDLVRDLQDSFGNKERVFLYQKGCVVRKGFWFRIFHIGRIFFFFFPRLVLDCVKARYSNS